MLSSLGHISVGAVLTATLAPPVGRSVSLAEERLKTKLQHAAGLTAANSSHFHCLDRPEATAHVRRIEGEKEEGGGGWKGGKPGVEGGVAPLRGDLD